MKVTVALVWLASALVGTESQMPSVETLSKLKPVLDSCIQAPTLINTMLNAQQCMNGINDVGSKFDKVAIRQKVSNCFIANNCTTPPSLVSSYNCQIHVYNNIYRGALRKCVQDRLKLMVTFANSKGIKIDYDKAVTAAFEITTFGSMMNGHLATLDYRGEFVNDIPTIQSDAYVASRCPNTKSAVDTKACIDGVRYNASNGFFSLCKDAKSCEEQLGPHCMLFYNFLEENVVCPCDTTLAANMTNMINAAKSSACKGLTNQVIKANFISNLGCRKRWYDTCANFFTWWPQCQ